MSYPRLSLTTVSVVQKNIPCLYWTRHHWTKSSFHAYGDPLSEACRGCTLTFRGLPDFPQSLQFLGSRESMCCSHLHRKQRSGFLMVTGLIQIWRGQTLYLTCSLSERDLWVSRVYECRWSRLGDFEIAAHSHQFNRPMPWQQIGVTLYGVTSQCSVTHWMKRIFGKGWRKNSAKSLGSPAG